ncbi:hypothetical protein ENBRE01_1644 [Enteropsectra breve]|nr:hypothetical protein ENBRE01_1644 [Enteropsectra breve]
MPDLTVDVAGSYWPVNRDLLAVGGLELYDTLCLEPNYSTFFCSAFKNYNMVREMDICDLSVSKANVHSRLEDLIPAAYKRGAEVPYTSTALVLGAHRCRLAGTKTI